jgi:cell division protein FtsB
LGSAEKISTQNVMSNSFDELEQLQRKISEMRKTIEELVAENEELVAENEELVAEISRLEKQNYKGLYGSDS